MLGLSALYSRRWLFLFFLLAFIGPSIGFFCLVHQPPTPLFRYVLKDYYLLANTVVAIFIGLGVKRTIEFSQRKYWPIIVCTAVGTCLALLGVVNYPKINRRSNFIAYDHARNILKTMAHGGRLISSGLDVVDFPILYMRNVNEMRSDIRIYSRGSVFPSLSEEERGIMKLDQAPIYYSSSKGVVHVMDLPTEIKGILNQVKRNSNRDKESVPADIFHVLRSGRNSPVSPHYHYFEREVMALYPFFRGNAALMQNDVQRAIRYLSLASEVGGDLVWVNYNIGVVLMDGKLNRFAKRFFQKSIETNPNLIFAYLNLALIFGREGEIPKAIELVETALRIQPNSKEALHLQKSLNNG